MTARLRPAAGLNPMWLGWLCLLPALVTVHAAYLLSAAAGHVPWCVPHLEGCTSISRAVRQGPANPLFRVVMLPAALLLGWFWWLCTVWLAQWRPEARVLRPAMLVSGLVGAGCLALYAYTVGGDAPVGRLMREYGGFVFAAFTGFAQLLLMSALVRDTRLHAGLRRTQFAVCAAMLLLGLASLPVQSLVAERYAAVSAIQWQFTVLMLLWFPLTTALWRRAGLNLVRA